MFGITIENAKSKIQEALDAFKPERHQATFEGHERLLKAFNMISIDVGPDDALEMFNFMLPCSEEELVEKCDRIIAVLETPADQPLPDGAYRFNWAVGDDLRVFHYNDEYDDRRREAIAKLDKLLPDGEGDTLREQRHRPELLERMVKTLTPKAKKAKAKPKLNAAEKRKMQTKRRLAGNAPKAQKAKTPAPSIKQKKANLIADIIFSKNNELGEEARSWLEKESLPKLKLITEQLCS